MATPKSSSRKNLVQQDFEGGWSIDPKVGIKNSFAYSQAFDFRKSPSQMTVYPATAREDNGIVKDLVLNEVMAMDGTIFAYGNAGYFYRRATSGTWSTIGSTGTGYGGIDYRRDADSIYLAGAKSVSLFNPVSSASAILVNKYNISQSLYNNSANAGFNVNANQMGSTNTTTPQVAATPLLEGGINIRYFQSDIEPLNKISVFVVSKGTGDWTLTLHDGLNNSLATATVTNANLVNNTWNDFVFSNATNGQVRIYVAPNARTYHLHLTSTVADGSVSSTANNDMTTIDLQVWADRLVQTNNGLHPIQRFLQYECIGNGNYLSIWEPLSDPPTNAEWQRHRLVFPMEYEVCGLALTNEFIVIAAEKNTSSNTSVPQSGILFFWDGTSQTYNYDVPISEGSPQGLHTFENIAYYFADGSWWAITSPVTQPVKIRTMPGSATEFSGAAAPLKVYPYAATVRRGIHLMGYPGMTTNTSINYGVYSWGAADKNLPQSFGYNYLISTGSQNYSAQNNLQIGMVKNFGDTLHISWRDSSSDGGYGVDVVNNSSAPASFATWQSMIFDDGIVGRRKTGDYMEIYYDIPDGATIQLGYQINRDGKWVMSQAYSTTNLWEGRHKRARFSITSNATNDNGGRFHEIQLRVDVNTTTATTPTTIYMIGLKYDPNADEQGY